MSSDPPPAAVDGHTLNVRDRAGSTWASDYRTLRDFRAFEIVNAMRLSVSLDGFRTLVTLGSVALIVVGTLVFVSTMSVLRDGPLRNDAAGLLNWGLLAVLYAAATLVLSEIVSNRRLAVSGTPHLELFRAIELPFQQVVVRYGLVPTIRRVTLVWYSAAVFLVIFFESTAHYSNIVLAAASVLALASSACLYSVVHFASAPARRIILRWPFCLLTLLLGLILGAATGLLMSRFGPVGDLAGEVRRYLPVICLAALAASVLLILLTVRKWRSLAYRRITLTAQQSRRRQVRAARFVRFVFNDLFHSTHGSVVSTVVLVWIAVTGFLLGANDVLPIKATLNGDEIQRSLIGVTILLSLGVTEPMLYRIGPTAKLYHYRFAWENGNSTRAVVIGLIWVYFLLGVIVGLFVFCAAFLALGVLAPGTILVGLIVISSGIIGEALSRPSVSTDGTKSNDVMDALFTLLLISPCSLILVVSPGFSTVLLLGYTIFLTLGVAVCLRTRLLKLRLRLTP